VGIVNNKYGGGFLAKKDPIRQLTLMGDRGISCHWPGESVHPKPPEQLAPSNTIYP